MGPGRGGDTTGEGTTGTTDETTEEPPPAIDWSFDDVFGRANVDDNGKDEYNPVGPIYGRDREGGAGGPIGTGVLTQLALAGARLDDDDDSRGAADDPCARPRRIG